MADALEAATALKEGKMSDSLKKFLKGAVKEDKLAVFDHKLATSIHSKLKIECVADSSVSEIMRGISSQLINLLSGNLPQAQLNQMTLGLAHSLSRYKLKFSPDKVDTMVVQAICTHFSPVSFRLAFLASLLPTSLCSNPLKSLLLTF